MGYCWGSMPAGCWPAACNVSRFDRNLKPLTKKPTSFSPYYRCTAVSGETQSGRIAVNRYWMQSGTCLKYKGSCEAVPSTWIDEEANTCQFPLKCGPKISVLKSNYLSQPHKSWKVYEIKIVCFKDDYLTACQKATKYQFTSNVDTTDESNSEIEVSRRKRRKINNKRWVTPDVSQPKKAKFKKQGRPASSNDYQQEKSDSEKSELETTSSSGLDPLHTFPIFNPITTHNELAFSNATSQNLEITLDFPGSQSRSLDTCNNENTSIASNFQIADALVQPEAMIQQVGNDNICLNWNSFSQEFKRFQRVLLNEIQDLKTEVAILKCAVIKQSTVDAIACPVSLPIKSEADLADVELLLQDVASSAKFFNWCETVGGREYKHHSRRLLSRIFAQSLALNINLTGISKKNAPKIAFKGMNIYKVVIRKYANSN
ncbi:unnamed protein product [Allacma fusca]|uniref:DUF4806 domain-containing protein n=1 Tax=Allacma fusca TaxID=39272 RepID=A0A8J2P4T3_9HEXA|nr:unnamed protein product [Allacma fusca]